MSMHEEAFIIISLMYKPQLSGYKCSNKQGKPAHIPGFIRMKRIYSDNNSPVFSLGRLIASQIFRIYVPFNMPQVEILIAARSAVPRGVHRRTPYALPELPGMPVSPLYTTRLSETPETNA